MIDDMRLDKKNPDGRNMSLQHIRRVAALDIGGNDIKLMVKDLGPDSEEYGVIIGLKTWPTRLRMAISDDGSLDDRLYSATLSALNEIEDLLVENMVDEVHVSTCSAGRAMSEDALASFKNDVKKILNADLVVIPEEYEGKLGFKAVLASADINAEHVLVIDTGGGSTEITLGRSDGTVLYTRSIPAGGNSLKKEWDGSNAGFDEIFADLVDQYRWLSYAVFNPSSRVLDLDDDSDLAEFVKSRDDGVVLSGEALAEKAAKRLADVDFDSVNADEIDRDTVETFIIGGTSTTFASYAYGLRSTDPYASDGMMIDYYSMLPKAREFFKMSNADRLATGSVIPGREHSIQYSTLVFFALMKILGIKRGASSAAGIIDSMFSSDWDDFSGSGEH